MVVQSKRSGLVIVLVLAGLVRVLYGYFWIGDGPRVFEQVPGEFEVGLGESGRDRLRLTPRRPIVYRDKASGVTKQVHGRFLHVTDIHPDPFYEEGSSIARVCHGGKPDGKKDRAPIFGTAMSGCDSSMELSERTLDWIAKNLKDQIDFVVWTGDNIRHDNDRRNPRTETQIFHMNEVLSKRMHEIFHNNDSRNPRDFDADVIPSIGNNDVFPHNLFSLGPTLQTREFQKIWNPFIPQEQQRMFDRGVSYFSEIIPGKLAVLSINTLYMYKANPLVDNCDVPKQPGYQLMLWLGYILEELRNRKMKVWITGHVPPIPKNYEDSCFHKFNLWTHEYRDIIVGGTYGHMNMDHFIPLNGKKSRDYLESELYKSKLNRLVSMENGIDVQDDDFNDDELLDHALAASEVRMMGAKPVNKEEYMKTVKKEYYQKISDKWSSLKGGNRRKRKFIEKYNIINIAGSVIPTFNPALRIWEYNVTALEELTELEQMPWEDKLNEIELKIEQDTKELTNEIELLANKKHKNVLNRDKSIPKKKPKNIPLGPAYIPQLFTPTRFIQYYADLKSINKKYYKLIDEGYDNDAAAKESFEYIVEYASDDPPYNLKSLLVKDYLELAQRLTEEKKTWKQYLKHAFISSGYKDD